MKRVGKNIILFVAIVLSTSFSIQKEELYSLTVEVKALRNSKGNVQFALYNKDGSIPDEDYKKYFRMLNGEIINNLALVVFRNLPAGKYAVNILHDENRDGKIDKGFILPEEGIGFSNFQSIGFSNRPDFSKASFDLKANKSITVKVIYM